MDEQLEQIRDIWTKAFFDGDYEILQRYERDDFKVIYEQEDRVESTYVRYDRIAHAVQNSVWKPRKLDLKSEEYTFNADQTECQILIQLEHDDQKIQELWVLEDEWKVVELRFLKP